MSTRVLAMLGSLILLQTGGATAQDASDVSRLLSENIVSTPSKNTESASHAPATVSIVSAEDIHRFGVRSLDEALNFLAHGVLATDPAHAKEAGARGVLLTGDYNNHFLVLLNGHALNEVWDGTTYIDAGLGIPLELIDHIEVTLGPGSVMYGSEAMLGVINVITRKASAWRGVSARTEMEVAAPVRRNGDLALSHPLGPGSRMALGYGRQFELLGSPAELVLAAEYRIRQRPSFELGPQPATDEVSGQPKNFGERSTRGIWGGWTERAREERVPSAYAQLSVADFSVWLRAAEYYRESTYLDSTVMNTGNFDDPRNLERDRWFNIDARQRLAVHRGLTLTARGHADFYGYRWANVSAATGDCPVELPSGCTQVLQSTANSYGLELRASIDWGDTGKNSTLLGGEVRLRQVESSFGYVWGPSLNGYRRLDAVEAAYVEHRFAPASFVDFNLGARLDHYGNFGTAISPRASIGVEPWRGGHWKNIYSAAFRAPSFYELNYRDTWQLQNANLTPERVWSLESALEQSLGAQRIAVALFYSSWERLVQYVSLTRSELEQAVSNGSLSAGTEVGYQYRNSAALRSVGGEIRAQGQLSSQISYGLSTVVVRTQVETEEGATRQPLTIVPSTSGNARLAFAPGGLFPTLALAGRFEGPRYADRAFDGGFAGSLKVSPRVDLKLTATGPFATVPGLSYRLGAGYSFARVGPYVIGPTLYATSPSSRPELSPIERLYLFGGLEFAPGW